MSALKSVNPQADVIGTRHALMMNINAAKGLADVVKSNLGPRGTMKMSSLTHRHRHTVTHRRTHHTAHHSLQLLAGLCVVV